jgi:hypothetical protein
MEALEKLQAATTYDDPKLDFIKGYAYDLGMNDLVKYGADQYVIGFEISFCFRSFTLVSRSDLTLWEGRLSSVMAVWLVRVVTLPS